MRRALQYLLLMWRTSENCLIKNLIICFLMKLFTFNCKWNELTPIQNQWISQKTMFRKWAFKAFKLKWVKLLGKSCTICFFLLFIFCFLLNGWKMKLTFSAFTVKLTKFSSCLGGFYKIAKLFTRAHNDDRNEDL